MRRMISLCNVATQYLVPLDDLRIRQHFIDLDCVHNCHCSACETKGMRGLVCVRSCWIDSCYHRRSRITTCTSKSVGCSINTDPSLPAAQLAAMAGAGPTGSRQAQSAGRLHTQAGLEDACELRVPEWDVVHSTALCEFADDVPQHQKAKVDVCTLTRPCPSVLCLIQALGTYNEQRAREQWLRTSLGDALMEQSSSQSGWIPARSTKLRVENLSGAVPFRNSMVIRKIVCDREDVSFILVAAVCLRDIPLSSKTFTRPTLSTTSSCRPAT